MWLVVPTANANVAAATSVVGARIPLVLVANRIIVCEELVPNLFASVHQRVELLAAGTSGTFALPFFLCGFSQSLPRRRFFCCGALAMPEPAAGTGRVGLGAFCFLLSVAGTEIFTVLLFANR